MNNYKYYLTLGYWSAITIGVIIFLIESPGPNIITTDFMEIITRYQ